MSKHFKIKEYLNNRTAEQIFSLCLFVVCISMILFCALVRIFGILWFSADLSQVYIPSQFWQDRIMNLLFIFEITFVYKILCRISWTHSILISIAHTVLVFFIPTGIITNLFNICMFILIPLFITRKPFVIIETLFLYLITTLYGLLFLVGRIGNIDNASYNFVYNILGAIDYKLFFVSIYLFIKYYGGIPLWKQVKILTLREDQNLTQK